MNIPNKLTLSRFIIAAIVPVTILLDIVELQYRNYIAASVFLLGVITDILDGYIARKTDNITIFGIFIDPIADKTLVISAMISLVYINRLHPIIAIVLIGRDSIMTGFRLIASSQEIIIPALISGKIKTASEAILIICLLLDIAIPILETTLIVTSMFFAFSSLLGVILNYKEVIWVSSITQTNPDHSRNIKGV